MAIRPMLAAAAVPRQARVLGAPASVSLAAVVEPVVAWAGPEPRQSARLRAAGGRRSHHGAMAIVDDDGFGYHDVDRMVAARRGPGLRCDPEFVQQLVDGALPAVRAQEYGLLTPEEADEDALMGVLAGDVAAVGAYGAQHPETWAGIRLDREGVSRVVVASFTADLGGHRDRLAPLVTRPDRLRLRQMPFSQQELDRVLSEIGASGSRRLKQWGIGDGAVEVALAATAEALAAEWHGRYGDAVRLHVGNLPYPLAATPWPVVELPQSTTTLEGVELRIVLRPLGVASGEDVAGELALVKG